MDIFVLPEGKNFETYLVNEGYTDAIESALNQYHNVEDYVNDFIASMNDQKMKGGATRNYKADADGGRQRALLDILTSKKTVYAEAIAQKIVALKDKKRRIPQKIKDLFEKIYNDMGKQIDAGQENK